MNQIDEEEDPIKQIGLNMELSPLQGDNFFCSALEQKVFKKKKTHKWLWKAVVNQVDEENDIIKQIGPNMVLKPV